MYRTLAEVTPVNNGPTRSLILPNGILVNNELVREVEILKFGGPQEDLIRDKRNLKDGSALEKLLKSTIIRVGPVTKPETIGALFDEEMLVADMTFLLIQARIFGIGKNYSFQVNCPHCGKPQRHRIDLSTQVVDEQPEEARGKKRFTSEAETEDGEKIPFTFRQLYVKDMKAVEAIQEQYGREKGTRELCLQITELYGKPVNAHTVKNLSWMARNALRAKMDEFLGGIDTDLVMECSNSKCEQEFTDSLPIHMKDFFFPASGTKQTLKQASFTRRSGGTRSCSLSDGDGAEIK